MFFHAKSILSQARNAATEIASLAGSKKSEISLGISENLETAVIPLLLRRLKIMLPDLLMTIDRDHPRSIADKIRSGTIDFGIGSHVSDPNDPDLLYETVFTEPYVLVSRPGHPLAKKKRVSLKDVGTYDWVISRSTEEMGHVRSPYFNYYFSRKGVKSPEVVVATNSFSVMRSCIVETDTIAILPKLFIADDLASGHLVGLGLKEIQLVVDLGFIFSRHREMSDVHIQVCEIIRSVLNECAIAN
ncbi:MAG: substrate-binding domain-containing protein [Rhodospirillaceae bacterium]